MGRKKGVVDFDESPLDDFDLANQYKDPVAMLEMREHLVREKWIDIEKAKIIRETPVVLPHRRRQPPPEVPPPRPPVPRIYSLHRLGEGPPSLRVPWSEAGAGGDLWVLEEVQKFMGVWREKEWEVKWEEIEKSGAGGNVAAT